MSKRIVIELPEPERVRVRYGRAVLTIVREGGFYGTQLASSIAAYRRGELGAEALSERFARARVVQHTPSFSWSSADWHRVLDLVVKASLNPEFESSEPERVAEILSEALAAESKKMRESFGKLASPLRGFEQFDKLIGKTRFDLAKLTGLGHSTAFSNLTDSLGHNRHLGALLKPGILDQIKKTQGLGIGKQLHRDLAGLGKLDALNLGGKAFDPQAFKLPNWIDSLPDPAPWVRKLGGFAADALESFKRALPLNWRDLESDQLDNVVELMKAEGYGLAWVPRAEILSEILNAPDHPARAAVLEAHCEEILEDIETALELVQRDDLQLLRAATVEAIETFRAGHPGPAQTYAASAIGELVHGPFGAEDFGAVKRLFQDTDPMHDVGFADFPFYALGHALVRTFARFKDAGDGFNRNLTQHRLGAVHNEPNLLMVLMLLAGLLIEVQRILNRQDRRRDDEAA